MAWSPALRTSVRMEKSSRFDRLKVLPAAITPVRTIAVLCAWLHARASSVAAFEKALGAYLDSVHVLTFRSLMRTCYACFVALSRRRPGKFVVLPRYSCPSFLHGVLAAGLEPKYCDIDPATLSIDIASLRKLDLSEVVAVVCTNLFGFTSRTDEIVELCRPQGVFVVEGADYGLGSVYKGRKLGTLADAAILNFQEGKAIPVGGGAVVSRSVPLAELLGLGSARLPRQSRLVTLLGYSVFSRPHFYKLFLDTVRMLRVERKRFSMEDSLRHSRGEREFQFDRDTALQSTSPLQAEVGLGVLRDLPGHMATRLRNAQLLHELLAGIADIELIRPEPGLESIHYIRFPVLVTAGLRAALMAHLLAQGLEASPMYVEHGMHIDRALFPGSCRVAEELLTLPCHPYATESDIRRMASVIRTFMRERNATALDAPGGQAPVIAGRAAELH